MNIGSQWRVGTRVGVACVLIAGTGIGSSAQAAVDGVNGVTVTSITVYAGTNQTGALIFFSPAKPGMGGCLNSAGNAVWVDWSSQIQPDGKSLVTLAYADYVAGKTIGIGTSGCDSSGYYPVVTGINL